MREAGVNLVTVGIFSWAHLEPAEGRFDFGWLRRGARPAGRGGHRRGPGHADGRAAALADHALPRRPAGGRQGHPLQPRQPPALLRLQPDLPEARPAHRRARRGRARRPPGRATCGTRTTSTPATSRTATAITTPRSFRSWLERRYGCVEALNDAWGSAFWSQRYSDFAEVTAAQDDARHRQPQPGARLQAVQQRGIPGGVPRGEAGAQGGQAGHPADDELHGLAQAAGLLRLGTGTGRGFHRQLPGSRRPGQRGAVRHALRPDQVPEQDTCRGS